MPTTLCYIVSHQISGAPQAVVNPGAEDANDAAQVDRELFAEEPGNLLTPPIAVINNSLQKLSPNHNASPNDPNSSQTLGSSTQPAWAYFSTQAPREYSIDDL